MDKIIKQILAKRGIKTETEVSDFLHPSWQKFFHDPYKLKDMKHAVERIKLALQYKEKIAVYGDFDGDGIPGAAMMFLALKKLGAKSPLVHIGKAHDIDEEFVKQAAKDKFKVIIAIDLGGSSFGAADMTQALGIDLIIVEHHIVQHKKPKCFAFINPEQKSDTYPWPHLSGAGVALKMIYALSPEVFEYFKNYFLALTAIAAVHDRVPLRNENRFLVGLGIQSLLKTRDSDLINLMKVLKIKKSLGNIGHEDIFHILELFINIFDSQKSCEFLIDPEHPMSIIRELADVSVRFSNYLNEAVGHVKRHPHLYKKNILFEVFDDVPYVTTGAIASRIFNYYGVTTIVIRKGTNGVSRGSARSSEALNLMEMLDYCKSFLYGYGGHKRAAGFKIKSGKIDEFKMKVEEYLVKNFLKGVVPKNKIRVDATISVSDLTAELYANFKKMAPFGMANPIPLLMLKNTSLYLNETEVAIKDETGVITGTVDEHLIKNIKSGSKHNVAGHLALKDNLLYFKIRSIKPLKANRKE